MRVLAILLAMPVAVYLVLGVSLYFRQDGLLFRPVVGQIDPVAAGVAFMRPVTLHTSDGLDLTAWFSPAAAGEPTVLYLHGNGGNIAGRAGRMRRFESLGWGELFVEYRGYGPNPGRPSEGGFYLDAQAGAAFLAAQGIPAGRVVLYGESLGTGVAVRLAGDRPFGAVILDSPYTSIAAVAQAQFPYVPAGLFIRNKFRLLSRIDEIRAPLLVMQGALDEVVPPAQGRAVYAAAREPKMFWVGAETRHSNVLESGGAEVMVEFVDRYVGVGE